MKYIFTFLISMVPLVELRGAIPFAIANGIPLWTALLIGVIGNLLPVPSDLLLRPPYSYLGGKKTNYRRLF